MARKLLTAGAMQLRDSFVLTSLLLATACPASPAATTDPGTTDDPTTSTGDASSGGTTGPIADGLQHFLYVLSGDVEISIAGDARTLAAGGYANIVIATGVVPRVVNVDGLRPGQDPRVITYAEALSGAKPIGKRVAIIGAGPAGLFAALTLVVLALMGPQSIHAREDAEVEGIDIVLASGKRSDFYINGKKVSLHPEGLWLIAKLLLAKLKQYPEITAVGGLTIGADPLASEAEAMLAGCWPEPEYADTMNKDELGNLKLSATEEAELVAFLKTLSDE